MFFLFFQTFADFYVDKRLIPCKIILLSQLKSQDEIRKKSSYKK